MKKTISLVLMLITLLSLSLPANAALVTTYTDKETGNVLTLPSKWQMTYYNEELQKVEFLSDQDGALMMTYGSTDLYADLDPSVKSSCPRSAVNNDLFTEEEIADILDADPSEVCRVYINGIEYFLTRTVLHTTYNGYSLEVDDHYWLRVHDGWLYLYRYVGNVTGSVYDGFEYILASATYGGSGAATGSSGTGKSSTYQQAVNAYNAGNYSTALSLFQEVPNYENSQDYMRLIRIRTYGENIGIGCVYDYRKGLTDQEKADIDKAMENFYFADTADVLMCNTDVATYVLFGNWNTAPSAPVYSYLRWHKDSAGGYYYTRSNNVSTAVSDCVSINDGYVRVSITSSNTLVFHIKLTGPNSMSLYCYEYDKCVELFRQ